MVVWYVTDVCVKESEQSSPFRRWTTGSGAGSSYRHHDHRNMYNKQMSEGSSPVLAATGTGSNVARWSLGLEQLLADPAGAAAFAHFLSKEFAAENIRFWWSCEQYSSTEDSAKRAALAKEIWQRHLSEKASEPVNVDAAARRAADLLLYHDPPPPDLFQQAQKQIFNVMKFDSYPRFLRSSVHAECARADLRGQPSPYAPVQSPAKLKKSSSNASERRRSGGTSLLPWKLRTASRERSNSTQSNDPPPVTDVVKSSQSPGQCLLCRVVLPDGATSVVGVEDSVTVAGLVDRLLQRRNLICPTYDVLLKDVAQGQSRSVEASAPSSILGGREAVVERRCVVRLEVRGRLVAVRCRPERRLRHVLKPVLARYARAPAAAALGARLLHPDTLIMELDGARLQIVEAEGGSGVGSPDEGPAADDDGDSITDLALRLHEDAHDNDDQSSTSSTSGRGVNGMSGERGANGTNGVNGANGGRVRAALRPGPPLHHHPPDFLDNLRSTQRQMLQSKARVNDLAGRASDPAGRVSDPASRVSDPAACPPRTPPPLPPKPHRPPPTVV